MCFPEMGTSLPGGIQFHPAANIQHKFTVHQPGTIYLLMNDSDPVFLIPLNLVCRMRRFFKAQK